MKRFVFAALAAAFGMSAMWDIASASSHISSAHSGSHSKGDSKKEKPKMNGLHDLRDPYGDPALQQRDLYR